jgi:lincosamide nucleotidyltransferase A/C/D/E
MNAKDVVALCSELESRGIAAWLNGGWGVDALLGRQTRPHVDVDIFIREKDVDEIRALMESTGYKEKKLEIARPFNFVYGDTAGREVDVHAFNYYGVDKVIYGSGKSVEYFPAAVLDGVGEIEGKTVKCISPEWAVKWHTGYKLRGIDYQDVAALCSKFKIKPPEGYNL